MTGFRIKFENEDDEGDNPFFPDGAHLQDIKAVLFFDKLAIGWFTGTLVQGDLILKENRSLVMTLDTHSDELASMAVAIFHLRTEWYKDAFWMRMQPIGLNVLYLSRLTIDPRFRGHNLGLVLIQHVLRHFPHDVAVMKPFPLQHEYQPDGPGLEQFRSIPEKAATTKLRKYYSKIGFERVPRSPLMARQPPDGYDFIDFSVSDAVVLSLRETVLDDLHRTRRSVKTRLRGRAGPL